VAADLQGRIVVVSPHSDDGVLSLGAAMASWARQGHRVELLTVLALDPASPAETRGWDRRGGFATEGEAARVRREEDRRACAILGAAPAWLPFGSVDYERHGDEEDVREAVAAALEGAHAILLPGFPLSHPDHEWLVRALAGAQLPARVGLYAEQPYTWRGDAAPGVPRWLGDLVGTGAFEPVPTAARDRLAKWRAIARYRSQLPLLALRRSVRRGPHVLARLPEVVAWVRGRDRMPG
jgi:LmbE family N-acetylglucosaminyl deacetylase